MTDRSLLPVEVRPLPRGAKLYHIRNNSRLTRIEAVMRTGSIHEEKDGGCGLSHFLEHMLFQGCKNYPGNSASDKIHALGGDCNAYTTFDHTAYYVEVPVEKFAEAADVLAHMFTAPLFPEEKFNSEKKVIEREADMIANRPNQVLIQNLWQELFPDHPARFPIIGYQDKISQVTREDMVNYYMRRYGAMRSYWIVTGELDTDMVQAVLTAKLEDFQRGNLNDIVLPPLSQQSFAIHTNAAFPDPLCRIACGLRAPNAAHGDAPALDLLGGILGGSDSSLLTAELVYRRELALMLSSEFDSMTFAGVLGISAACEPSKQKMLKNAIADMLEKIRHQGISAEALKREKLQQEQTMYQLLKNSSTTVNLVNSMVMNFNTPDVTAYLDKLRSVTLDQINAVLFDYLAPEHLVWVCVEPEQTAKQRKTNPAKAPTLPLIAGKTANEINYILLERNQIPIDTYSVILPAGPVWESGYPHGISQLLSKMLQTGPANTSESKFYTLLDKYCIDLDVSCGNNTLSLELSFPPRSRKYAEKLLSDLLTQPRFSPDIFLRVRKNLAEQLASRLEDPNFAGITTAKRMIFGDHPAGNNRLESVKDLEEITPEILKNYYFSRFDRLRTSFGATIAANRRESTYKVTDFFEQLSAILPWQRDLLSAPEPASKEFLQSLAVNEIKNIPLQRTPNAVICAVAGGFAHTREYYALLIMDAALNGLASHLFKEVREKRSLAYSTGVFVNCGLVQGITALHAGVEPEKAVEALECLQAELDRLIDQGLTAEEFSAAKLSALSSLARQMESVDAKLMHAQLALFYGDDPLESLNSQQIINDMSLSECNALLKEVLTRSPRVLINSGKILS